MSNFGQNKLFSGGASKNDKKNRQELQSQNYIGEGESLMKNEY